MDIILPFPHPGQVAVRRQAKRFNWLSAGRRWRKTTLVMAIAVEESSLGKTVIWGGPTFDQVRVGWDETLRALRGQGKPTQQRMTIDMPNGGRIIYRSLDDPDNARGHSADGVVIDEVADVKSTAWYEVLRPMLIDTGGWAWGIGTPKGRNWFFSEFVEAKSRDDSASWQVPTLGCEIVNGELVRKPHRLENPNIPFMEIRNLWATMPQHSFEQEVLATFLEGEGSVFRNVAACMGAPLSPTPEQHKGHRLVAGCDWGKSHDFTAVSIGCCQCKVEVARDRFNKIDYAFQRDRIKALVTRWGVKMILAESNSIGEPNLEMLIRDGLPVQGFETTASTKPPLIENMALVFDRAEWQFQADPVWRAEVEAYEMKVSPTTGRSQYSAPEGMHDDTVMARALMLRAGTAGPVILFGA